MGLDFAIHAVKIAAMDTPPKTMDISSPYAETILNSLSAHIAIIDAQGIILQTNRAWQEFAGENDAGGTRPDMLQVNYLDICDCAQGETGEDARRVARGIRSVIRGETEEFVVAYPCHSPDQRRWFYMRAIPVKGSDPLRIVISHENITPLKETEEKLKEREAELESKTRHLEEANAALSALIRQRDEDLKEMEKAVFQNLNQGILPYLDQLRAQTDSPLVDRLESQLQSVASPFLKRLSDLEVVLTPQEIRIVSLVKQGRATKEIAELLNLSLTTVNFHRRNIRDKLGLKNTGTNLNTFLMSLA